MFLGTKNQEHSILISLKAAFQKLKINTLLWFMIQIL